jgi:hypothetical protein
MVLPLFFSVTIGLPTKIKAESAEIWQKTSTDANKAGKAISLSFSGKILKKNDFKNKKLKFSENISFNLSIGLSHQLSFTYIFIASTFRTYSHS